MTNDPESIEPRPEDELSVVSEVFDSAESDRSESESGPADRTAAMFYTQGGSPC